MVETIRLESGHTLTGIGGSKPSLSAIIVATCEQVSELESDVQALSHRLHSSKLE